MNAPDSQASLEQPFLNLRQRWPEGWPGLPLVLSRCLEQLGVPPDAPVEQDLGLPPATARLRACVMDLAQVVEEDGLRRAETGQEPAYHNRLHVADTLVALTLLLQAQRTLRSSPQKPAPRLPNHGEWLALLAMLGHDLGHDGRINRRPGEMETLSWRALQPLLQQHRVASPDQTAVQHMVMMTDPTRVASAHLKMADRTFTTEKLDALVILVEEADIFVSSLPELGTQLTLQLSLEWAAQAPDRAQALLRPEGRLSFLRHAALFSSPAAVHLGMARIRQSQIDALEAA